MDELLDFFVNLLPYICIFFFSFIVLLIFLKIISKKKVKKTNVSFYGLFMDLNRNNLISLSMIYLFYMFVLGSIIINNITIVTFIVLIMLSFAFCLSTKNAYFFIRMVFNSLCIYYLLTIKADLYNYMTTASAIPYVFLTFFMVILFIIFYSTYTFLKEAELILKENSYIKKRDL